MQRSHLLIHLQRNCLFILVLLSLVSAICAAFSFIGNDDFEMARREVLLRRIGHELLLQSGDVTSRVLPVKKLTDNEYQIAFEHELTFQPDSLMNATRRLLAKDPFASDYVVQVRHCGNSRVAYGYAISKNKKDDIVSCQGRKQPKACYNINIQFRPPGILTAKNAYLLGSLPLLAFIGFMLFKKVKPQNNEFERSPTDLFTLGSVLFDGKQRKLIINEKTIDLTATETRVLLIFAKSPNETIERIRLQKEIWEDEGVIVGRSLDMFISKLRKKLEIDPNLRIVVIRSKGYKLEMSV
ncbi:MAG: transcriptional regulator [Flavobacterium sp. BFFFF2]|nr:MAG: transcriptional regulator [Flavobacterium sp. BFFFF2]